jgi:heme oxygenase
MVAYAYDLIARGNPAGLFGMVFVLEGSSVALATRAAEAIRRRLGVPKAAFRYLTSHGALDQEHIQVLQRLLDRFDDPDDRAAVAHAATMFYRLYGDIFRSLPTSSEPERSAA